MFTIPEFLAARKPGGFKPLRCPHCQKLLNPLGPIVVATHNCPACGRQVLAAPEGNDEPPALTFAQLDDAHAASTRAQSRALRSVLVAFLAWFFVVIVASLSADTLRDALGSRDAAGWITILTMVLPVAAGVVVGLRTEARAKRTAPKCPHCATALYHFVHLTRITGNCFACGRRLAELPPDEPTGPLPTVGEYKAADRRANRSVGAALFLGAVVVAIPGGLSTFANPDRMIAALEPRYGELTAAVIGSALLFGWVVGLLVVAGGGIWFFSRRQRKRREADPILSCPRCRSELGLALQAVATRRCPKCRARVLADPAPIGVAEGAPGG
jgi:DNA-directed RNA polymerase subunit RPC12/RpoP